MDGSLPEVHRGRLGRATIGDQLRRHAQHQPNREAIVFLDPEGQRRGITYGQLDVRANRLANSLAALGLARGDVVAVLSHNSADYVVAWYAALKLGAPLTGVNFLLRPEEVAYQVNHSGAVALVVEDALVPVVEGLSGNLPGVGIRVVSMVTGCLDDAPEGWHHFDRLCGDDVDDAEPDAEVTEADVAMVIYTSGTEAFPKGVQIPHRNYLLGTTPAWVAHMDIRPEDTWLFVMPFFTMAGLGSMTSLTLVGATLVLPYAIDPERALRLLRDEGVTTMAQTPTFFLSVARLPEFAAHPPTSLRRCITYGGMVPRAMVDAWRAVLPELVWGTFWSQSELSQLGTVGWFRTLDDIPGADPSWIGKAMAGLELRVVDAEGDDATEGEVICRSPAVMLGYHDDPERTAEVFRDGWLHTGDVMRIDADGNLFFLDRAKDMIKSGGMNVSSVEVERALSAHPAVERAAVVGVPDEYWSEAVTAFVVLGGDRGIDGQDLLSWVKPRLAPFKVPKAVHVLDHLPVDGQGKVLKRELRARATGG